MTDLLYLVTDSHAAWVLQVFLGLLVGAAVGYVFFTSLHRNVQKLVTGSVVPALLGQLLRFGLLAPVLFLLANWGAIPLLAGTVGLTFVRYLVVHRLRVVM